MTNPGLGQSTPVEGGVAVSLLEVDPEIGRFLSTGERAEARRVAVPVRQLREGTNGIDALLEEDAAFGALLLDGMVLQRARIGDQVAVWLLGGGDMISLTSEPRSMLLYDYECETIARTRIALLGREVLGAIRRWPGLGVGLHVRVAEQHDRLAAQLVICQLPRVDQRLMAIMWLLAESWGHVTSAGTLLPVALTHNALGAMIGARRSTVTLALGELVERGALIRQDRGWLLLEPPVQPSAQALELDRPQLLEEPPSRWSPDPASDPPGSGTAAAMRESVQRLAEQHVRNQARVREQLALSASYRERRAQTWRVHQQRITR